ncbi:MAG: TetR/AcrR family transcriptional regulator [Candidatus Saccharimonadales bacterium]
MRITAQEKDATRERIVEAALALFRQQGFEATTTREIARAAEIATGTLFNYFPNKEDILGQVAGRALCKARAAFAKQDAAADLAAADIEEDLFALVAAELRQLKPLRKLMDGLLETVLCPLAASKGDGAEDSLRVAHLEIVASIARKHGVPEMTPLALQIYWALYTGVLSFWASDSSSKQEATLALLDQSLHMFSAWLRGTAGKPQ